MVLTGYFDESERDEGAEVLCVAGYVFKPTDYRRFCRAWRRMLLAGPSPVPWFHMTELYANRGLYRGWSIEDRVKVLGLAMEAVNASMMCGISVMFSQAELERRAPPELLAGEHGSFYTMACQFVVRTTAEWMNDRRCFLPVNFVFEHGYEFWPEVDSALTAAGSVPGLRSVTRFRRHEAGDKRVSCGLQAADMLAWWITRWQIGWGTSRTMQAFHPVYRGFMLGQERRYRHFHPTGEALREHFEQQAKPHPFPFEFDRPPRPGPPKLRKRRRRSG